LKLRRVRKSFSEETRKKMSEAKKGKNNPMFGKIGAMKGKHHSKESRQKMSNSQMGRVGCYKGKHRSEATKLKLSNSLKGRIISDETRQKMSDAKIGRPLSAKHRKKLCLAKQNMSNETKQKMRLAAIQRIERNSGGQLNPAYNTNACKIIEEYGKKNGYNFQHAMNGGEFHIKELGYWVDGYDRKKNIVIEYYERLHYSIDGILKNRELNREKEIIKQLNCGFIRINGFDKNGLIMEKIS